MFFRRYPVENWGVPGSDRMPHESSSAAERDLEKRSIKDITLCGKYVYQRTAMDTRSQPTTTGQISRQAFW